MIVSPTANRYAMMAGAKAAVAQSSCGGAGTRPVVAPPRPTAPPLLSASRLASQWGKAVARDGMTFSMFFGAFACMKQLGVQSAVAGPHAAPPPIDRSVADLRPPFAKMR